MTGVAKTVPFQRADYQDERCARIQECDGQIDTQLFGNNLNVLGLGASSTDAHPSASLPVSSKESARVPISIYPIHRSTAGIGVLGFA